MPIERAIFTVGHSTRSADVFVALLHAHQIASLVDVRRYPASRRYPHFGKDALAAALARSGVGYEHAPDLGGRRAARRDSPNAGIRAAGLRGYADHALSAAFGAALDRVMAHAVRERIALMCAEAVPWRCHRQIIADHLVSRGVVVIHILAEDRFEAHRLSPLARPAARGGVVYPDVEAQRELWAGAATPHQE